MSDGKTFIERLVDKEVEADDIKHYIEKWHEAVKEKQVEEQIAFQIYDYLGMTLEEYKRWVEEPILTDKSGKQVLNEIAEIRRQEKKQ